MKRSKQTKKALTGSVLALVLCFLMLLGTTFAWFTDTANTGVSKIQAGTLDVALEKKTDDGWESVENGELPFVQSTGHEVETILWEPGCTYALPTIRVVNKGNLALKYKVVVTAVVGGEVDEMEDSVSEAKLVNLAEVLDVLYTGTLVRDGNSVSVADENIGTLNSVLTSTDGDGFAHGNLAAEKTSDDITLKLHMQETAGNEYQNKSITGIKVTVLATQDTVEYDSIDNQYDKEANFDFAWDGETLQSVTEAADGKYYITTAAQFVWMMSENQGTSSKYFGKDIVLECDIDLGGATITGFGSDEAMFAARFDGQNHTVSNFVINNSREWYAGLFNQVGYGGSVTNLTVANATVSGGRMVGAIASNVENGCVVDDCHVKNCTIISSVKKAGAVVGYTAGGTVTNCTATNCTVYCADSDENESNTIVGYINNNSTVKNNTENSVTVIRGATLASSATALENAINNSAATVVLTSDITLTNPLKIEGKTLTIEGGNHKLTGKVISISNSANVTIKDLKITGITSTSVILNVAFKSNLTLEGNTEICNNTSTQNIIAVTTGSTLTASDNVKINNNTTSLHVLFVSRDSNGTFCTATLNNVEIKGNKANGSAEKFTSWQSSAGLIAVSDNGTLTINGGNIENNTVKYCTAGVLTTRLGTIALNGVTIKNNTGENNGTNCTCTKTTCISSHEVGLYNNVGQITISADCVLEGANHGSGMGGYVAGQVYNNRDYWPSHGSEGGATRPAY